MSGLLGPPNGRVRTLPANSSQSPCEVPPLSGLARSPRLVLSLPHIVTCEVRGALLAHRLVQTALAPESPMRTTTTSITTHATAMRMDATSGILPRRNHGCFASTRVFMTSLDVSHHPIVATANTPATQGPFA